MNTIDELGELALGTRMIRIAEQMRKDASRIYREHELEFESKWFPVLMVLYKKPDTGVVEIADEIGYTHQSVIALIKEMKKKKLVQARPCKSDGRKKLLSLTPKALDMIDKFQPLWEQFRTVTHAIFNNGSSMLKAIEATEAALKEESFYTRFIKLETSGQALKDK